MSLSDWEKWFFDHHGFLILEDVVPPEDIARMVDVGLRWHTLTQAELPPPLHRTGDPAWSTPAESPPGPNYINHLQYCDDAFARLVLNPDIMRVVNALTGGNQTLVDTALTKMDRSGGVKNEGGFHGELGQHVPNGSKVPGEQWKDYHVTADGEIFCGFLNCGVTLVDVPEGSGFVCIPGSHKRNFAIPDNDNHDQCLMGGSIRQIDLYDDASVIGSPYRYTVQNICPKAGSAIIFTETLRHGIRKWEATYPRLTVFNRYKANWPERYWGTRKQGPVSSESLSACVHQLPEEVRLLQEPSAGPEAKDRAAAEVAEAYTVAMENTLALRSTLRSHKL